MSLGKKLFLGGTPGCTTDTVDKFADSSGVALYSLDYDASDAGGNYDGTYNASNVTFGVDGQINWGASFNGNINSGIVTGITSLTNNFTISMWLNLESISINTWIFSNWDSTTQDIYLAVHPNGQLEVAIDGRTGGAGANIFGSSGTFTLNTWHHFVVTMSNGAYSVYLDNTPLSSGGTADTTTNTTFNNGSNYEIGNSPRTSSGYSAWNGKIDQVRVFSKGLSSTEVSTLYGETACVYTSTTDNNDYPVANTAYYKLDNNAEDAKGNYDGTATNVNYEFGRFGQAAVFNGSSSYITANKSMFGTGDGTADVFTISLWFNTTTNNGVLAGTRGNSATQGFILWLLSDGTIRYDEANATGSVDTLITTNTYDDGNWHNVVVTRNASNQATLYVDGSVQVSTTTITTALTSHTNNLFIGRYSAGSLHYNGSIDQVRIFNSALDATAVENLYNEKPEINTSNFETVLWNGNGGSQYVSSVGFEPDFVWIKKRGNDTKDHRLFDTVRGANKVIYSSRTLAEAPVTSELTSFEANGFMLGNASAVNDADTNDSYVAWCWKAGGDAVNNTNGNITSQVSTNQDAGFSIVKYAGGNSANDTVGHGLTDAEMIILKDLDDSNNTWRVWHKDLSTNNWMYLNLANAQASAATDGGIKRVNSNTFGFINGTTDGVEGVNSNASDYIAYCFHSVAGYQKVGSYVGNNPTSSTVRDITGLGFTPRFVLLKNASTLGPSWNMYDSLRPNGFVLLANSSNAEANYSGLFEIITDGFRLKSINTNTNYSTDTFIYLAIA